ncbi:uncharacterized protein E0L32_011726 [Thyridium curvatum]|uniref:Uncharacterized protein n=1 Tax=Thyridium curvatum TaxID=1093900 RepID=A0A507BFW9_9PEZI|nr:uncharacterized protein E0L32_011726 [Thyridium curvatum]TPX18393.1 hypothetical protein E0L32_011726 [Thyridium curvatum]
MSSSSAAPTLRSLERRPLTEFLSLAPATSASYPQSQKASSVKSPTLETASNVTDAIPKAEPVKRRSSSLSSDGKNGARRVLKLGPVHWGEHPDEHKEDWHEVAVE